MGETVLAILRRRRSADPAARHVVVAGGEPDFDGRFGEPAELRLGLDLRRRSRRHAHGLEGEACVTRFVDQGADEPGFAHGGVLGFRSLEQGGAAHRAWSGSSAREQGICGLFHRHRGVNGRKRVGGDGVELGGRFRSADTQFHRRLRIVANSGKQRRFGLFEKTRIGACAGNLHQSVIDDAEARRDSHFCRRLHCDRIKRIYSRALLDALLAREISRKSGASRIAADGGAVSGDKQCIELDRLRHVCPGQRRFLNERAGLAGVAVGECGPRCEHRQQRIVRLGNFGEFGCGFTRQSGSIEGFEPECREHLVVRIASGRRDAGGNKPLPKFVQRRRSRWDGDLGHQLLDGPDVEPAPQLVRQTRAVAGDDGREVAFFDGGGNSVAHHDRRTVVVRVSRRAQALRQRWPQPA